MDPPVAGRKDQHNQKGQHHQHTGKDGDQLLFVQGHRNLLFLSVDTEIMSAITANEYFIIPFSGGMVKKREKREEKRCTKVLRIG